MTTLTTTANPSDSKLVVSLELAGCKVALQGDQYNTELLDGWRLEAAAEDGRGYVVDDQNRLRAVFERPSYEGVPSLLGVLRNAEEYSVEESSTNSATNGAICFLIVGPAATYQGRSFTFSAAGGRAEARKAALQDAWARMVSLVA